MKRSAIPLRSGTGAALLAAALTLAGCGGDGDDQEARLEETHALPNISLAGSPNRTVIGPVDPHREATAMPVGGHAVIAAFRASECGAPAPDFARMMRDQLEDGLRVSDGITLYDAGIGHYRSRRCGARAEARAIGAYAYRPGNYEIPFFDGRATKRVTVR